jgi:hypothetical protein
MTEDLLLFKKAIVRYAFPALAAVMAATALVFWLFFIIPEDDAKRFDAAGLGDARIESALVLKAKAVEDASQRKKAAAPVSP